MDVRNEPTREKKPPAAIPVAAPNGSAERKKPKSENFEPGKENFFERLAQMTTDDWDRHKVYVYRRWPRIAKSDMPHYIGTHRQAIDEEFVRGAYGSGSYLIKLNDARRTIDSTPLEIQHVDYPPKIVADELVDCVENERYFKLWPAANPKAPVAPDSNDSAIKELTSALKIALTDRPQKEQDEVTKALITWALALKDREREDTSPNSLATLITALKGFAPAPTAPQVDMLAVVTALKGLQPAPQDPLAMLQQAKNLFAPANPPNEDDDLVRFERFLNIADKLAGRRGGSGSRTGWDYALDAIKEAPNVLSPILTFIGNAMALRSGVVPAAGAAPGASPGPAPGAGLGAGMPASFDPYRDRDAMAAYAASMRNQQAAPPPASAQAPASPTPASAAFYGPQATATAPPSTAPSMNMPAGAATNGPAQPNELAQLLAMYGGLVLNSLNSGQRGCDLADWLVQGFGAGTHALIAQHGEAALAQAMAAIPELSIFGEMRLRKFASEFCNYDEILSREEDESGEEDDEQEKAAAARHA